MGCGESKHQVVDGNTISRKKSSIVSRWYSRGRETPQETCTKSGSATLPEKNKGVSEITSTPIKKGDEDVKNANANANGVVSGGDVKNDSDKVVADVKKEESEKKLVKEEYEAKPNVGVQEEKEECNPNLKKQDGEPVPVASSKGNGDDGKMCSVNEKVQEVVESAKEEKMTKENVQSAEMEKKNLDEERKEESLVKETEAIKPIESGPGENVVSMIKKTEVAEKPVELKQVDEAKPIIKTEEALNVKDTLEEPVRGKCDSLVKETKEENVVNEETHVKEAEPVKAVAADAEELVNVKETEKVQAVGTVSLELEDNLIKETKAQASATPSKQEDLSEKKEEKPADSTTEQDE